MAMATDRFSLEGKSAVVTGAGTGLGEAMAIGLAEAGADVAGVYHTHRPDRARKEIEGLGRRFVAIQADLSTIEPVGRIVAAAVEAFGKLDILVNDAGIIRRAPALEFSERDWDDVIAVNLKSLFFLCQAAAQQFVKQGSGGKIINIASLLSFQGGILIPSYTASKSGIRGLTQLLANEWAPHGINVNAIAPGYMATSNTEPLRKDPARAAALLARIPAGRWGLPEELKGATVFLASEAATYVNGITLPVDGGWLGR
jgi:2-deoxy-D-gluconate 3-dehydrogenase